MLDQPDDKKAVMKKDVFIKGKQECLNDVVTFIANIIVFARFWVKFSDTNSNDVPLVIQMITEIADFLTSSDYVIFDERHKAIAPYMYHTLVGYIFNIFSKFTKMAKNPHIVRKLKIENTIDVKEIKLVQIMFRTLLDQLQLCSATSSLQVLFAHPPSSKRDLSDKEKENEYEPKKKKGFGSIVNKTGKKIFFPQGMEKRYCADFLDVGQICSRENCTFVHAMYPSGFTEKDKDLMKKHVENTEGLSFKNVS